MQCVVEEGLGSVSNVIRFELVDISGSEVGFAGDEYAD